MDLVSCSLSSPDWDLLAVVRGYTATKTMTTTTSSPDLQPQHQAAYYHEPGTTEFPLLSQTTPPPQQQLTDFGLSHCSSFAGDLLQDLFTPFFCSDLPRSSPSSSSSAVAAPQQQMQQRGGVGVVSSPSQFVFMSTTIPSSCLARPTTTAAATTTSSTKFSISNITSPFPRRNGMRLPATTQKIKKRKNVQKKVFHVPTEGLSSDKWAWRKYGQKPIKGSPHPRGYYRCSSSKGCPARKQVERHRSDADMFIVTYTSEHNHPVPAHRNSLAGSTRQKPADAGAGAATTTIEEQQQQQQREAGGGGSPSSTTESFFSSSSSSSSPLNTTISEEQRGRVKEEEMAVIEEGEDVFRHDDYYDGVGWRFDDVLLFDDHHHDDDDGFFAGLDYLDDTTTGGRVVEKKLLEF